MAELEELLKNYTIGGKTGERFEWGGLAKLSKCLYGRILDLDH